MNAIAHSSHVLRVAPRTQPHASTPKVATMPICPFTFPLATFALCAVPALLAVLGGPATEDIYAVIGAMLAAVVVLVDFSSSYRAQKRGTLQFITVFISSSFIGSIGPGSAAHWLMADQTVSLTWHMWAALGFIFGLGGWVLTRSVLWVFNRRLPGALDSFVSSKLPPQKEDE